MTRKDFKLIARIISNDRRWVIEHNNLNSEFTRGWLAANEDLAHDFAEMLAGTNPNFNRQRFLEAALYGKGNTS